MAVLDMEASQDVAICPRSYGILPRHIHSVARAELNTVRSVSTVVTWSSSQWRPDDDRTDSLAEQRRPAVESLVDPPASNCTEQERHATGP
jgi:hypothetical protein